MYSQLSYPCPNQDFWHTGPLIPTLWFSFGVSCPFLKTSLAQRLPKSAANLITSVSDSWIRRLRDFLSEYSAQNTHGAARLLLRASLSLKNFCKQTRKTASWVNFKKIWKKSVYLRKIKIIYNLELELERRNKSLSSKKFQKTDRKHLKRFDYLSVFRLKFFRFYSRHPRTWYLLINYVSRAYLGF